MEGVSGQRMQAGEQAVRGGGGGRPFLDLNLNRSKFRPPEMPIFLGLDLDLPKITFFLGFDSFEIFRRI